MLNDVTDLNISGMIGHSFQIHFLDPVIRYNWTHLLAGSHTQTKQSHVQHLHHLAGMKNRGCYSP